MKHISNDTTKSKLTGVSTDTDCQPNAVDLRLGRVFQISSTFFTLTDDEKIHRESTELLANNEGFFYLAPGSYQIVFENEISVGEGECGWVIPRSTLVRNGLSITTGLYDSGYKGKMVACLNVTCGVAKIKKGCRIAQYLCFDAEMLHKYDGDYGVDKLHDQKYNN